MSLDVQKISVKIPALRADLHEHEAINVFHRWIQQKLLADHLAIDVSDYGHVHHGPGAILVCHEAILSLDSMGGTIGLTYFRKAPLAGSLAERIGTIAGYANKFARLLQDDPALQGRIVFKTGEWIVKFHDRLLAPNDDATFGEIRSQISSAGAAILGTSPVVQKIGADSEMLGALVKA